MERLNYCTIQKIVFFWALLCRPTCWAVLFKYPCFQFKDHTRKDARRCRAGPLLVRLFWHDRAGSSILPALSEHLGVEDVEV